MALLLNAPASFAVGLALGRLVEEACGPLGAGLQLCATAVAWSLATQLLDGDAHRHHGGALLLSWGLACGMRGFVERCQALGGTAAAPPRLR